MNKLRSALLASLLLTLPVAADGYEFEAGYSRVTASDGSADLSLGSIYGTAGYRWDHNDSYSSSAELLLSFGIQDDELFGIGIELTSNIGVGYKGTWQTNKENTQLFWRANYAQLSVDSTGGGSSTSAEENDFGLGVGIIWKHVTLGYTKYLGDLDDFDSINIGYKF